MVLEYVSMVKKGKKGGIFIKLREDINESTIDKKLLREQLHFGFIWIEQML